MKVYRQRIFDPGATLVRYQGVGNGTLTQLMGGSASVLETFLLTATSSTNFTVVGSVSGALSAATVGTPYTGGTKLQFLLTAGSINWAAGDVFTITTIPVTNPMPVNFGDAPASGYSVPVATYNSIAMKIKGALWHGFALKCAVSQTGTLTHNNKAGDEPNLATANEAGTGGMFVTTGMVGGSLFIPATATWQYFGMIPNGVPRFPQQYGGNRLVVASAALTGVTLDQIAVFESLTEASDGI
jgi:hypothetical protein